MSCKAFTLLEVVTVIAIVAILTALSIPLWSSAKKKSFERDTESSLHQAWIALEIYRQDFGQSAQDYGSGSEMGLPNVDQFFELVSRNKISWWNGNLLKGYGPIYYPYDPSDILPGLKDAGALKLAAWRSYSQAHGTSSIIIGDFNHTEGCGLFPESHCLFKGFGVTLDGSLRHETASGRINNPFWWDK